MPDNINCKFCNQLAPLKVNPQLIERGMSGVANIYWCAKCSLETIDWHQSKRVSWSLYTEINGRTFRWTTYSDQPDYATLWRIGIPGIPGETINQDVKCVAAFGLDAGGALHAGNIIPEITPQNIVTKVSIYLAFL